MSPPSHRHWLATALAHALLADAQQPGGRTPAALRARAMACLGADPSWLAPLLAALQVSLAARWAQHTVPTLAEAIARRPELDAAFANGARPGVRHWLLRPACMAEPVAPLASPALPDLPTRAALAQWLGIGADTLGWLVADTERFREGGARPQDRLYPPGRHYHALLKPKRDGGLRLIELPKPLLKAVQRRLLHGLLDLVPAHEAAQGFVRGRDVRAHAALHAGQAVVLCFDLRAFFNGVGIGRVRGLFRALGYPEDVAGTLAALCTTRTRADVRERLRDAGGMDWQAARRLASPHLPQGAPSSPALANLCAFGLDLRLDGLAARFGARYSRYADDMVFSGPAALRVQQRALQAWVAAIVEAEGFALHPGKTRSQPAHGRQRVTGVVVNARPNLAREDYDLLRAALHRAARDGCDGPQWQRLQGQVAWACRLVVPARGDKLRAMLARCRPPAG